MAGMTVLAARGVSVRYGGVQAVHGVDLEFHAGEVTGIIGPNGAGKSTFLAALSGQLQPFEGRVEFAGRDVTRLAPFRRARLGLARTFQTTSEFAGLTVFENLVVAGLGERGSSLWHSLVRSRSAQAATRQTWARAWEVLERFEMAHAANLLGSELSGGQRRLLEVMRCLMREPKMILLDEPMVGVATHLVARLVEQLRSIADDGIGLVIIEHALEVVGELCDRVVVLASGEVIADGAYGDVVSDRAVRLAYLA